MQQNDGSKKRKDAHDSNGQPTKGGHTTSSSCNVGGKHVRTAESSSSVGGIVTTCSSAGSSTPLQLMKVEIQRQWSECVTAVFGSINASIDRWIISTIIDYLLSYVIVTGLYYNAHHSHIMALMYHLPSFPHK
jgi:hypothetical protein